MAGKCMQTALLLVVVLPCVRCVRHEDAMVKAMLGEDKKEDWGERTAGSYCCYNVDSLSRGRFTVVSKGYVNTDDIMKCDIVADNPCPLDSERFEKNSDGSDAFFLDQAKIWDATTDRIDDKLVKDGMEKVKAVLHTHVKNHVGAFEAYQTKKIDDDYKKLVDERTKSAEQVYQEEKARIEKIYSDSSAEYETKNKADIQSAIGEVTNTLTSKTADATKANAESNVKSQAAADEVIKAAQAKLIEDMRQSEEAASHAIQEATDVYNSATNKLTEDASAELQKFVQGEQNQLENETEAALDTRKKAFEEVVAQEKETRDVKLAPIANLVAHTTGNWSVASDVSAMYDTNKDKCGGGDCCCLGTLGEDSRTYQAYKVPKNFAFSTCKDTAPYSGGVFGLGTCQYFRHCKSCIKKLCNDQGHCGSVPLG